MKQFYISNLKSAGVLLFFTGLVAGMLSANLFFQQYLEQVGVLGSSFLRKYQETDIVWPELFLYLCKVRMIPVVLLLIGVFYRWGLPVSMLYDGWLGFAAGMMFAAAAMQKGFSGVLLVLSAMFPQYLLYIPAFCLLY